MTTATLETPETEESLENYFDEYERIHVEMKRLSDKAWKFPILSDEAKALRVQVDELRERAMALIPYGATTPNKTWDGKRA